MALTTVKSQTIQGDTLTIDGSAGSSVLNLDKADAGSGKISFKMAGTQKGYLELDSSEDVYFYGVAGVDFRFWPGGSEKVVFGSDGKILVGTTNAGNANADNLTIADSAVCGITIRSGNTSTGNIFFSDATGASDSGQFAGAVEYGHNDNSLRLHTNENERIRIDSGGNIGIGTASPTTPDGSNADNPLNGTPVLTLYGDSPGINLVSSTETSDDWSLINFGRLSSSTNPYRAVIGYHQSTDILHINSVGGGITFDVGGAVNTNERVRIDGNGNVGIGTDDPWNATSYRNLELNGTTGGVLSFSDDGVRKWEIYGDDDELGFYTRASTEYRLKIKKTGNVEIYNGDLKIANGHGIDFSSQTSTTQTNASTESETLDHYEEGSWTPTILGTTANPSGGTFALNRGTYIRVGRNVTVQAYVSWNNDWSSANGYAGIGGLPWTVSSATTNDVTYGGISIGFISFPAGMAAANEVPTGYMESGQGYIRMYLLPSGSGAGVGDIIPAATWFNSNAGYICFTATYRAHA